MQTRIRQATPADAPTLLSFIRALADFERAPEKVEVDEATLQEQLAADAPPFLAWIAETCDEPPTPCGFALAFTTYSTWRGRQGLWLEDLYVDPAHRRRGVGGALLHTVAAEAVARGCGRLELTVLDWNTGAQDVYRAAGLTPLSEWRTWRVEGDALEKLGSRPDGSPAK